MGVSEFVKNLTVFMLLVGGALTRVVDGDSTALPDYEYADLEAPTTIATEEPECPPGTSYISRSDIQATIEELSSEFEEEYTSKLLPWYEQMRNAFREELKNFKTFMQDQSTSLKSVLENIARQREGLHPDMDHLVNVVRGYSIYKKQFDMLLQKKTYIMKNYKHYKQNCQHSCEEYETRIRLLTTLPILQRDGYTCISMQGLFQRVKEQLSQSAAEFNHNASTQYQNIEQDYRKKIDAVKKQLKYSALKALGEPMFDVLSLQDALYQFTHNVELENLESILYEISTNILNIGTKLNVLNRKVKDYGMRCRSNNSRRDLLEGDRYTISTETGHTKIQIIDELVNDRFHHIQESVTSEYGRILNEVDAVIKDVEGGEIFSAIHPNDVNDEVREMIQREQQAFGLLQRRVPDTVLENFNILLQKTREAL